MSDIASPADEGKEVTRGGSGRYAWYVFYIMFFINFLNYMDRYVLTGAANIIAHELHFGVDGIGYLATAFLLVYTLSTIPLGVWADRSKRKNVVAICIAVWSAITALTALANSFLTLFITRMILGIGEAGYYPAGTALLSDYFSRTKRARIMSWWSAGSLVGLMVGFVVGGVVASYNWRLAFLFTGVPGLILAYLAWRLREPRRNEADEASAELDPHSLENELDVEEVHAVVVPKNVVSQFGTLLRIKTVSVLILMQIFAFFVLGANVVYLPTYLQQKDTFGLSSSVAGLFSGGVVVVAGIAGLLVGGYLSDLLNRRYPGARVLVCGIGFLLGVPSFILAVTIHSLPIFTVFFILTVLLLNVYSGPSTAATQDVVPSALRASAVAISLLIAHLLGDAFSPLLVGVLAQHFDPTHGQHFAQNLAGHDLSLALLITCPPALLIAGLIGIFGARWMKGDIAAAVRADQLAKEAAA
ncbi:MAG TPA: MFS transporter [Ktedonobacteraceae bacterium]|nr:MFS transporter [Ktedonobacteraceae bacterium]